MKNRRVLITGGQGFVGSILAKSLRELGDHVVNERFDVTSLDDVRRAFGHAPDLVYHLASPTDVTACERDPAFAFRTIATGTENVLKCLSGKETFVFASSSMVYRDPSEGENVINEEQAPAPTTVYGKAKLEAEKISQGASHLILRIFPHTHQTQKSSRFLSRTKEQLEQIAKGETLTLDQSLMSQGRDIGAVGDLVSALAVLRDSTDTAGIYNICSGRARRLGRLAEIMATQLGRATQFKGADDGKLNSFCGDNRKFEKAFGFKPKIQTDEELIAYYLRSQP